MKFERMKCGNCGRGMLKMYAARAASADRHAFAALELRCKCGVRTRLTISQPRIVQDHHANPESRGSHCIGW